MTRTTKQWLYGTSATLTLLAMGYAFVGKAAVLEKLRDVIMWLLVQIMTALLSLADILVRIHSWSL